MYHSAVMLTVIYCFLNCFISFPFWSADQKTSIIRFEIEIIYVVYKKCEKTQVYRFFVES